MITLGFYSLNVLHYFNSKRMEILDAHRETWALSEFPNENVYTIYGLACLIGKLAKQS